MMEGYELVLNKITLLVDKVKSLLTIRIHEDLIWSLSFYVEKQQVLVSYLDLKL